MDASRFLRTRGRNQPGSMSCSSWASSVGRRPGGAGRAQQTPQRRVPTVLHIGDEAQREKNSSQVETQTLRGENQSQTEQRPPAAEVINKALAPPDPPKVGGASH